MKKYVEIFNLTYIRQTETRVYFRLKGKAVSLNKSSIKRFRKWNGGIIVWLYEKVFDLFNTHYKLNLRKEVIEYNEVEPTDFDILNYEGELHYTTKDLEERKKYWPNEKFYVGKIIRTSVAAPGTGYYEYEVTAMNRHGVFTKLIESTVRELTLADVM